MNGHTTTQRILIVDDESDFARGIARHIAPAFDNTDVALAENGEQALELLESFSPDVMLLDLHMPDMHGLAVMESALERDPGLTIIVLTAHGTVETAVNALKNGAWDFLTKPVRQEDLLRCVAKACERSLLWGENRRLASLMAASELNRRLIGESLVMRRLKENIRVIAAAGYTVLIRGESGTSKELVAKSIHALSDRRDRAPLSVNCPAIPEQLLESELFGHVRGAFTGASTGSKGLFQESSGSTLILDEIGDIPMSVQIKLLRALQEGEVRPVGSSHSIKVNTRIIAITNQDLEQKIRTGRFREDLFYRLNVLPLRTPPLRERREDIPLLATHFLNQTCQEINVPEKRFAPEVMESLCRRDWPGNVRQLQNTVRRMAVFSNGRMVTQGYPGFDETADEAGAKSPLSYKEATDKLVDSFTRQYVTDLLQRNKGNVSEAARHSGLERASLQKILRRLGIDPATFRP
jgi:DNA-binding NtrC family response regulator